MTHLLDARKRPAFVSMSQRESLLRVREPGKEHTMGGYNSMSNGLQTNLRAPFSNSICLCPMVFGRQ